MIRASQIVYSRLTPAELYNINKPKGSEERGGGQTYIDFPTSKVSLADWQRIAGSVRPVQMTGGPSWSLNVHSMGVAYRRQGYG